MQKSFWLVAGGFLILLIIAAVILSNHTQSLGSTKEANFQKDVNSITLQNGQLTPPIPLTFSATQGQAVNFKVATDEDGQIHFHSGQNELHQTVKKGQANEFSENFSIAGSYTIEFHPGMTDASASASASSSDDEAPGVPLGTIAVSPK